MLALSLAVLIHHNSAMTIIYLLAALQAFFLVSLLLPKKQKSSADKVLMAWLVGIGIHTLIYFLYAQIGFSSPLALNLNAAFPYLQGPFLLAYTATLIGVRERFAGLDYLHLVPFVGFVAFLLLTLSPGTFMVLPGGAMENTSIFAMSNLFTVILLVSVPAYIAASLVLMRRAASALDNTALPTKFRWVYFCIAGLGVVWLIVIISFARSLSGGHNPSAHMVFVSLTLFVYGLGYLGINRTAVFSEPEMETLKKQLQQKYLKSGLKPDRAEAMHRQLLAYMDEQKPFLVGELSLQSMAADLGFSANHLSQVINAFEQCNFHDFVNARRVTEACRRLDESADLNLLELAMDVGFNSKSSFNRAFRKQTGHTPSEYISGS